jgi:DHA2 family multidrug resistance protein
MLWSIWEMSRWTPEISTSWLVVTTFIQGIGMGMTFVPMNLIGFATLPAIYRTDGSAVINLIRNMGSAIGVSITTTFLASSTQIVHAQLAEHASPFNRNLAQNAPSMLWNPQMPFGATQLDAVINMNAQVIAYANDFLFMFYISLPSLLIILLMRKPTVAPSPVDLEVME